MSDYDPNYIPVPAYFLLGVKVIVVNQHNQILVLKRSDKVSSPHHWDFPGGGVDKGENPYDSVIRECFEETSLNVTELIPLTTVTTTEKLGEAVIIGYKATTDSDNIRLSWEHDTYLWVNHDSPILAELPHLHSEIYDAYKKTLPLL